MACQFTGTRIAAPYSKMAMVRESQKDNLDFGISYTEKSSLDLSNDSLEYRSGIYFVTQNNSLCVLSRHRDIHCSRLDLERTLILAKHPNINFISFIINKEHMRITV